MKKALLVLVISILASSNLALAQMLEVCPVDSKVKWQGSKPLGKHTGNVSIKEAKVDIDSQGIIQNAEIEMDMTQITSDDLRGDSWKKLINHFNSKDFFNTDTFKTASFRSKSVKKLEGDKYEFSGNLQIKNLNKPISFIGNYSKFGEKHKLIGEFLFNRKDYDIRYGSGKFFSKIGDKIIHDNVLISFDLVTR